MMIMIIIMIIIILIYIYIYIYSCVGFPAASGKNSMSSLPATGEAKPSMAATIGSKRRDPDPKDNSLIRKETSTHIYI